MVLPVACFRGKPTANIEMWALHLTFLPFTVLLELELRSKRNRAKITGCGVNVLSTRQVRRGLANVRRSGFNAASERPRRAERTRYNVKALISSRWFGFAQKPQRQPDLSIGNRRGKTGFVKSDAAAVLFATCHSGNDVFQMSNTCAAFCRCDSSGRCK